MHLSNLRLLAVGLAGFDIAVGSPCKPISSASDSSIATTATTSGSSSFTLSLYSSATFTTTTTEVVTPADTTTEATTVTEADIATTEATTSGDVTSKATTFATSAATTDATTEETTVTETVPAGTEATTSGDMTSEATIFATSAATTVETSATVADTTAETTATSDAVTTSAEITEAPTTTEATTTAAPTTTTVPMFRLVPESGTYANQAIASNRYQGSKLTFNSLSGYREAFFTVDSTTGHLLLDGQKPICGWTPGDGTSALVVCSDNMSVQEKFITCEAPTSRQLECTVPELFCSMFTGCTPTGNLWGTTYIGASGGTGVDTLFLGPENKQGDTPVPLLIVHSSD